MEIIHSMQSMNRDGLIKYDLKKTSHAKDGGGGKMGVGGTSARNSGLNSKGDTSLQIPHIDIDRLDPQKTRDLLRWLLPNTRKRLRKFCDDKQKQNDFFENHSRFLLMNPQGGLFRDKSLFGNTIQWYMSQIGKLCDHTP